MFFLKFGNTVITVLKEDTNVDRLQVGCKEM